MHDAKGKVDHEEKDSTMTEDEAKSGRKEGNRITWTFADPAYVDLLMDTRATVEQIASEVYGERMSVEAKSEDEIQAGGRRAEDKPSALRDDPVVRAFQKHLGADIVKETR